VAVATGWTLGYDAADPHRLAAFWVQALGYIPQPGDDDPDGASIVDPDGNLPAIDFARVPEGKTAKNRVHIDLEVAGTPPWDMAARATPARQSRRARRRRSDTRTRGVNGEDLSHIVMLDPEGNEFCVA
jgi:Glyoxalase-like domain